jgi:hypothetical protein
LLVFVRAALAKKRSSVEHFRMHFLDARTSPAVPVPFRHLGDCSYRRSRCTLFSFQRSGRQMPPGVCPIRIRRPGFVLDSPSGDPRFSGADRDRTDDLRLAKPALSQLSYSPEPHLVGQGRLELPTSRLSGVRSNHLSYWPGRSSSGTKREAGSNPAALPTGPFRRTGSGRTRP